MMSDGQRARWPGVALELAIAWLVALAYLATCSSIRIDPLDRAGQVSGLAALSYRFMWFAVPLIVALIVVAKRRPARWDLAVRIACAAFAGLASAIVAGGVLCMLRGTSYGLAANTGDSVVLADWAQRIQQGVPTPGLYPPLQIHLIAWISDLRGVNTTFAVKSFQLIGILAFGPAGYAAWRLVLRPTWALGLGVVCALPLLDAYRVYPFLTLIVFLPVVLAFLENLRRASDQPVRALAIRGVAYGLGLGVLFLLYSGWFEWSIPGVLIATLWVFPWRAGGARRGAALCGAALVVFLGVTGYSILRVIAALPIQDYFQYFDSTVEPAYIAMWRGDLPGGLLHLWPPVGELGGVGLFTVVLCAGWAASIALGARRTVVMATSWIMVGTWLLRFRHARLMWKTKMVQLYPRTTAEILYCLLILTGFAIYLYTEDKRAQAPETSPLRSAWGGIAALCGIALLVMSAGSAIVDRYMPRPEANDYGHLAYLAQIMPHDGQELIHGAAARAASARDPASIGAVIDQQTTTVYESAASPTADHEEWIEVSLPAIWTFSRIVLVPAGEGFPVDFTIDVWDGEHWLPRVTQQGYRPTPGPQSFTWGRVERTNQVRLHVTKLGPIGNQFGLRLAELEVHR
jgi:galactan 5-O-arabinofuranosyltransferase